MTQAKALRVSFAAVFTCGLLVALVLCLCGSANSLYRADHGTDGGRFDDWFGLCVAGRAGGWHGAQFHYQLWCADFMAHSSGVVIAPTKPQHGL